MLCRTLPWDRGSCVQIICSIDEPPLFAGHKYRTVQSVATMPAVLGLKPPIWMFRVKPPMSDHGNNTWLVFLVVSKQAFIVTIWYSWSFPHSFWHSDADLITIRQLWNRMNFERLLVHGFNSCFGTHLSWSTMCDFTQIEYRCFHLRYIVRSWCATQQESHTWFLLSIVAM